MENKDIYIVSYPRSGNTWLRFILANLYFDPVGGVDFTNIHEYSPETGKTYTTIESNDKPKIIKSHDSYRKEYKKVIYILRDGRDVYTSYYFYLKNMLPGSMTFNEFLLEAPVENGRWSGHVNSWRQNKADNILFIRYEAMKKDIYSVIKSIAEFCDITIDKNSISNAVNKSDFQTMAILENKHGRGKYKSGPERFMRKGKIGDWKNIFDEDSKNIFKQFEGNLLVELGYEKDNNW